MCLKLEQQEYNLRKFKKKKKKTFCNPANHSPLGSSPSISWFFSPPPYFVGATHHWLHHRCHNQFFGSISQFATSIKSTNLTADLVLSPQYGFWDCLWMPILVSATGFVCLSGFYHWFLVAWFVLLKTMKDHLSLLGFNLSGFLPISSFFLVANLSLGELVEKFKFR